MKEASSVSKQLNWSSLLDLCSHNNSNSLLSNLRFWHCDEKYSILSLKYWMKRSKILRNIWSIYCTSKIVILIFLWEIHCRELLPWSVSVNSCWYYYKFTQTDHYNTDYINTLSLIVSGQKRLTKKRKTRNGVISISQVESLPWEKSFQFSVVRPKFFISPEGLDFA